MLVPSTVPEFLEILQKSGVVDPKRLKTFLNGSHESPLPTSPAAFADLLTREALITRFQARHLLKGKWRLVLCGKYTILEPIGSGGMGNVFLCAHKIMKRFVAVKVLSTEQTNDPSGLERFHREARAVAHLRHPNIAVAYDVDKDPPFHFLVMEFVDGTSLQQLVKSSGSMNPIRAAHYIHQAALGLQHAHEAGLVHRDVKPANLIVDREGTLKILDLGLARFFHDHTDELTKKHDTGAILGTADYLAPEQVIDSHNAFPRADIYSLGLTFYFLLAGQSAVQEGSTAQKLLWHQNRNPKPLDEIRNDVPRELTAIMAKMIQKSPDDRFQTMAEVAEALSPWTQTPISPPSEMELPHSALLRQFALGEGSSVVASKPSNLGAKSPAPAKSVTVQSNSKSVLRPNLGAMETVDGEPATTVGRPRDMESIPPTRITRRPERKEEVAGDSDPKLKPAPKDRDRRRQIRLIAGISTALVVLLVVGIIAALQPPAPKTVAVNPAPPPSTKPAEPVVDPSPQQPAVPKKETLPTPEPKPPVDDGVSIVSGPEAYEVRTPRYEATLDKADGCLSSFRVGGVEFFKVGAPLAGGKSFAKGSYFYSEKDGNKGLIKLPDIKVEAPHTLIATGGKFSVRYEFKPDLVNVIGNNASDDTVPFYLIFDSTTVHDVMNEKGEQLAVPVAMTQGDALDPKWRSTTWMADRARLKVTDRTENPVTKIWGPFSEFNSQVWEADATTYNRCQFTMEAWLAPAREKPTLTPGGVLIAREGAARKIQTELYEAKVDVDGCMPSLRIDGVEVLRANIDVSRGAYFLQGRNLQLPDVKQPSARSITAQSPLAAIVYDFAPNKITLTVENKTDQGMPYFIVFDTTVTAVRNAKDEWSKAPTAKSGNDPVEPKWSTTTWFAGRAKLKLLGGTRVWGPWQDKYQVWEATLNPKERRIVTIEMGLTDEGEAKQVAAVTGSKPVLASDLSLYAPLDYQVYQRRTKREGAITVRGSVRSAYDRLEICRHGVSVNGSINDHWEEIPLKQKTRTFEASIETPAGGWYKVEVRALKDKKVVGEITVDHVGVGEVFVGAGQSNSTNSGQERIKQYSGMVSSFSGNAWQPADDPQPGVHDNSTGGSYWPAFGDEMYAKYHVPIGVASTGHSGTSIDQWAPGGELFQWLTVRMRELGREGFRAVLWHQGESDVSMSSEDYARKMTALIRESRKAVGWEVPWFVAQVSYHNPSQTSYPTTRAAQKKLWESGIALEGPDTDTLTGDNRDDGGKGIHFSAKGLKAHGKMWADKVAVYLDKELAR